MSRTAALHEHEQQEHALRERFNERRADNLREQREHQRWLDDWDRLHDERWGRDETDPRRMAARAEYEAFKQRANPEIIGHRSRLRELQADLLMIDRDETQRLADFGNTRPYFGSIAIPSLGLVDLDNDETLKTLRADRDAAVAVRADHATREPILAGLLVEDEAAAAPIALRYSVGLATFEEARAADAHAAATRDALTRARDALASAEQAINDLDKRIADREEQVSAQREDQIRRMLPTAATAAADAVYAALVAMTRFKRLRDRALKADEIHFTLYQLNADDPRAEGLRFLESVAESGGWKPKTR